MRELQIAELCYVSGGAPFCGPQNSWASNFIPDEPFGFNFGPACKRHDDRYLAGIEARSVIDADFRNDMLSAAGGNPVGSAMAYVYYGFVCAFGGFFYGPSNADAVATAAQAEGLADRTADYAIENDLGDLFLARGGNNGFTSNVLSIILNYDTGGDDYFTDPESAPPGKVAVA